MANGPSILRAGQDRDIEFRVMMRFFTRINTASLANRGRIEEATAKRERRVGGVSHCRPLKEPAKWDAHEPIELRIAK